MQLRLVVAAGLAPALVSARALARRRVDCTYSTSVSSGDTCQSLASNWGLSVDELTQLNPGITCPNLDTSKEYCVLGSVTGDPTSTTTTTSTTKSSSTTITTGISSTTTSSTTVSSSTTTTSGTPTTPGNGVTTPLPTQSGMVGNCNKFHFVDKGQTCATIAALYSISTAQFTQWNPAVNSDCTGLWASTYACVGLLGGNPTTGPNGIVTPTPTQPGMVSNCNKFVKVNQGDTCDSISFWNGVAGGQWVKQWNNLGEDCVGLQVGAYVCIGVIPDAPQPTATTGPNGISTPLPTQPHMVSNCDKFVLVKTGDTCDGIAFWNGVAGSQWVKLWNGLADDCRDIWANAYACIGVLG